MMMKKTCRRGFFLELRIKLDNTITYGSKKKSFEVAALALEKARKAGNIGEIEYFQGQREIIKERFSSAIEHFDLAIRHNPADGAAYNDKALCLVELGFIEEGLRCFDKGIKAEPDYATIYHNKGWLLNNIGLSSQAIECFNKALFLEPDRAVTYDNLADAFYNLGEYRRSLECYEKVLVLLKPGDAKGIRKPIKEKITVIKKKLAGK